MALSKDIKRNISKVVTSKDINYPFIKISCGTMNKNATEVMYAKGKCKVSPVTDKKNYENDVNKALETLDIAVKRKIIENGRLDNKHIFMCDMTIENLKLNKKSHFKYDMYVKYIDGLSFFDELDGFKQLVSEINGIIVDVMMENGLKLC